MKTSINTMNIARKAVGLLCAIFLSAAVYAGGKVTYYHNDLLGSPVAATDESGELLWREAYAPYGAKLDNEEAAESEVIGYTGHKFDEDIGLTYAGARYYDQEIGRFMGIDPVGFVGASPVSFNRYTYANNNPYKFIDPNGMWSAKAHNKILSNAFSGRLPAASIAIMQAGSVVHDVSSQSSDQQFKHSMGGKGQSPSEARIKRNAYVQNRLKAAANTKLSASSRHSAMTEAFHAITDSYSPAHTDSDDNLLNYEGRNKGLHTVFEGEGIEGVENLTPELLEQMSKDLNGALNYIQSGGEGEGGGFSEKAGINKKFDN